MELKTAQIAVAMTVYMDVVKMVLPLKLIHPEPIVAASIVYMDVAQIKKQPKKTNKDQTVVVLEQPTVAVMMAKLPW